MKKKEKKIMRCEMRNKIYAEKRAETNRKGLKDTCKQLLKPFGGFKTEQWIDK